MTKKLRNLWKIAILFFMVLSFLYLEKNGGGGGEKGVEGLRNDVFFKVVKPKVMKGQNPKP